MGRLFGSEQIREVPLWVGRDRLLDDLRDELLVRRRKMLVLVGQGGIGKTSLAVKLLEAVGVDLSRGSLLPSCSYQGVLLIETSDRTSDLISEVLRGLGVDPETIEVSQRIAVIFQVLRQQTWLVVLDNLEDMLYPSEHEQSGSSIVPEVGEFLNGLVHNSHQSQIVLTSRELPRDLSDRRGRNSRINSKLVRVENVKGIDKRAGAKLLRDFGVVDDDAKLEEIALRVGGHVFVLTQLAAFAVDQCDGRLYRYLQQHPELYTDDVSEILKVQLGRRTFAQRQLLKRMCVLRFLTDVRGLTFLRLYEDEWETDGRLVIADGSPMPFSKAEQAETQRLVDELVQVSLVEKVLEPIAQIRQYRLHPVVTEFLQEHFTTELPSILQRALAFYQRGNQSLPQDLATLQQLILAPLQVSQHLGHQGELGYLVTLLMNRIQDNNMMSQMWEMASLQGIDELDALLAQAVFADQFGNWNEAEVLYQQALLLAQEKNDRPKIALAIGQLGSIESNRGNWDAAERLYRQSLQLREELGDRSGMASSWGQLGNIERNRGNWDAAERLYRQSLQVEEELGDRSGVAWITSDRGANELGRGNLDLAESLLLESLNQSQSLEMKDLMAETNGHLAQLYHAKNNPELAQQHYTIAHQLFTQLGALKDIEKLEGRWRTEDGRERTEEG